MPPKEANGNCDPHGMDLNHPDHDGFDHEWPDGKSLLESFRITAHAHAERPETFWEKQRLAVEARIGRRAPIWWQRPIWVTAAVTIALLVLMLSIRRERPKGPDLASRNEQELLLRIDRALSVSVLVIDCTEIGEFPPTATLPTQSFLVFLRAMGIRGTPGEGPREGRFGSGLFFGFLTETSRGGRGRCKRRRSSRPPGQ